MAANTVLGIARGRLAVVRRALSFARALSALVYDLWGQSGGWTMRTVWGALCFAAVVFSTAAQAEKRTFIIANNADGYGVDRCLATGASCGIPVATAYCQSRDIRSSGLIPQGGPRRDHGCGARDQRYIRTRRVRRY